MVYLTMTSIIVEALEKIQSLDGVADEENKLHDATKSRLEDGHARPAVETRARNDEKSGQPGFDSRNNLKGNAKEGEQRPMSSQAAEPSLLNPKLGNAISHGQLINLSRKLKAHGFSPRSLDILLSGARIYNAPPPPKPEPVNRTVSSQDEAAANPCLRPPNTKPLWRASVAKKKLVPTNE